MNAWVIFLIVVAVLVLLAFSVRIVKQYERGVVLRFGRLVETRNPGLNLIIPFVDRMTKVSLRVVTWVLDPQEVITRDNVTVRVDAVVYFMAIDPVKAVMNVEDYKRAMARQAESEREKRAKVIHAEGERAAAKTLAEAAEIIQSQPAALQLRYLQTLVEMAGERNSTIIPLTVDIVNALSNMPKLDKR